MPIQGREIHLRDYLSVLNKRLHNTVYLVLAAAK
jgi:hypothetical protein